MLSSSRPARRALASQRRRAWRSGPSAASEPLLRVPVTNVPLHRVRVDRQPRDDLLDRWQLVALPQQAEPQCVPDLVDQLQVGCDPGTGVQMEIDHDDS